MPPPDDRDLPPADAVPLCDAVPLARAAAREKYIAEMAALPHPLDEVAAWFGPTDPALLDDEDLLFNCLCSGVLQAWGREGALSGPWVAIDWRTWFGRRDVSWSEGLVVVERVDISDHLAPLTIVFFRVHVARSPTFSSERIVTVIADDPPPKRPRGRQKGATKYPIAETMKYAERMHQLITDGRAATPNDASTQVVDEKACKGCQLKTAIDRLAKFYRGHYGVRD
jgi:hypothetical protein